MLRNAIIPCKRLGLIFNLVEPGRALMKFIANLSDACTTSSGMQLLLLRVELKGGAPRETGDKHSTVIFHTQWGDM